MNAGMSDMGLLSILVVFLAFTCHQQATSNLSRNQDPYKKISERSTVSSRVRERFRLPDLFDFSRFKSFFKKSYDSVLEEVVRRKLYLGRAFNVFISAVSYKYRISSSYLAINHMSDWTLLESTSGFLKIPTADFQITVTRSQDFPVVSSKEIRRKFSYIMDHKDLPGFREIYRELRDGFKLELTQGTTLTRSISADDLMRIPRNESINKIQEYGLIADSQDGSSENLKEFGARMSRTDDELDEMHLLEGVDNEKYLDEVVGTSISNFGNLFCSGRWGCTSAMPQDENIIDHRLSNCFFQPRNQGKCGSCYAFTAIALYEYAFCRVTGRRVAFSEQYIIDCGEVAGLHGCKCGWFSRIPNFVKDFGLEFRSNYPYINREGVCPITQPAQAGSVKVKSNGFVAYNLDKVDSVLKNVPMAVNVFVTKQFREYGGGVDDATTCRDSKYLHAMVLIGTGIEDGKEFWLLRNSFSTVWGIRGHYKLNRASDCIRNNMASALFVTFDLTKRKRRQNVVHHYKDYMPSDYEE